MAKICKPMIEIEIFGNAKEKWLRKFLKGFSAQKSCTKARIHHSA